MTEIKDITVGVVIPCYNHGKFLKESVNSILQQTHENLKIIIVNDGSVDDTDYIAKNIIDNRVKYISFKENRGKWFSLNTAIENLDCNVITSHDADDISLPNRIEGQLNTLLKTNTLHNLCGFHHCWNENDVEKFKEQSVSNDLKVIQKEDVYKHVMHGYKASGINHYFTGDFETAGTTAMFFKDIWNLGVKFNPPSLGLRVLNSEDSDFNFRVTSLIGKTSVTAEKLYLYRRNTSTNDEVL